MARNVFSSPRMEDPSAVRPREGCKLFVKVMNSSIKEPEIRQLFQQYGNTVEVFRSDKNWAFVTYEYPSEAYNAITAINRLKNVPLHVTYAHSEGSRKSNRRSDSGIENNPNTRGLGRGHILNHPYFDGRHRPLMFEEGVFQDSGGEEPLFANIQCTVDEQGRRLSKGLGFVTEVSNDWRNGAHTPFRNDLDLPLQTHGHPFRNDMDLQFQKQLTEDDVCTLCKRTALKECGVCSMPYCSRKCQLKDFTRHKQECAIPPLVDRKTTTLNTLEYVEDINRDDKNLNKSKRVVNKDSANKFGESRQGKHNAHEKGSVTNSGNHNGSNGSNDENVQTRSHKNKNEFQHEFHRSHKDADKKNGSEVCKKQSEQESANNENKEKKGAPAASNPKRRNQETRGSQAAAAVGGTEMGSESVAPKEITIPLNKFSRVMITVPEDAGTYWVQSAETLQTSLDIYNAVSTAGVSTKESCKPKMDELYIAPFQGDWFRAKVISLKPELRVLFIDYGNEESCSPADLKKLPESCKKIPPLAFRIKLVNGTSKKYLNLASDEELSVMPIENVAVKGAIVVCVEGDEPQTEAVPGTKSIMKDTVKAVQQQSAKKINNKKNSTSRHVLETLKEDGQGVGKIVRQLNEEETIVITLTENLGEGFCKVIKLSELALHLPKDNFKPKIGELVAAEAEEEGLIDGQWGRAIVLANSHDRYLVNFVDDCLVLRAKNIRKLPEEIANIPVFGAKLSVLEYKKPINGNWSTFFKNEDNFSFDVEEVIKSNKTAVVAIKKGEEKICRAILSCWNPVSDINSVHLKDGAEVTVVFFDCNFLFVRPLSLSYSKMFADLEEDLCSHCKIASSLNKIPSLKAVVACKYSQNSEFYRAQVVEIFKDMIKVQFVDYGNEDTVKLESLKTLSDELLLYPFMAAKISLKDITGKILPPEATNLLLELSQEEKPLIVKFTDENASGIELVMEDGITLTKKVKSFFIQKEKRQFIHAPKKDSPAPEHTSSSAVKPKSTGSTASSRSTASLPQGSSAPAGDVYSIDKHLKYEGLPVGNTVDLLVLHKINETDFMCCSRDSAALVDCYDTLNQAINVYCSACEEHYRPRKVGELCLVKFDEDQQWYRAMCLEVTDEQTQSVKILFIDFGNVAEVDISQIRRMVPEFLKTPAVAHLCTLQGSEKMSEAEKDTVRKLVKMNSSYEAKILETRNTSAYVIEMLHVTNVLATR